MEYVMIKNSGLILLAVISAGLSGCATMSGDECMTSDWSAIGYEDGARGYTTERLTKHRKACAKHGVTLDFTAYQAGRDQGLVEYCQPSRGFNVGANGGRYHSVCSVNLEPDFLDGYNAGHHLYALRANVNRASSSIHSKERELKDIDKLTVTKAAELISDDKTMEERVILLVEIKEMSERTGQLEAEIRELYDNRARSQVELEHYQIVVADMGY
jgi:hypothetical protein